MIKNEKHEMRLGNDKFTPEATRRVAIRQYSTVIGWVSLTKGNRPV